MVCRVIEDAQRGKIQLFTSYAAIAECPQSAKKVKRNNAGRDIIEVFFEQKFIIKVNVEKIATFKCREIQHESKVLNKKRPPHQKPILKPMDAIHVAISLLQNVEYLFTYDSDHLIKYNGHALACGVIICEPCRPWEIQTNIEDAIEPKFLDSPSRMKRIGLEEPYGKNAQA